MISERNFPDSAAEPAKGVFRRVVKRDNADLVNDTRAIFVGFILKLWLCPKLWLQLWSDEMGEGGVMVSGTWILNWKP